jgi:hypothetical protein
VIGFTATGFHYGLTRSTDINRGNAGDESVTDYKFTQFFDDIFAVSVLYLPYIYVHSGLLIQNQIDPNPDGTMSYFSSRNGYPLYKYFLASNLLGFLDANATSSKGKIEKIGTAIEIKSLALNFANIPAFVPKFTIGYKFLNAYHDEGYDSVWVKSAFASDGSPKTDFMANSLKQSASLQTLSFLVQEDLSNILILEFFTEFQYCNKTLIEKSTDQKLTLRPIREIRGLVGVNVFGFDKTNVDLLTFSVGVGNYWDPGISVQRSSGTGNSVTGGIFSVKFENPLFGAEFMVDYNYSKELRALIEATDKVAIEGSAYFRI